VATVAREASVQEAARAMAESGCRVVLVGQEGALEGVLTEHDVLIRVVAAGLDPGQTQVAEIMSAELFTCREDQAVEEAAAEMREHRVSQLPVLDRDGRLVGLLTHRAAQGLEGDNAAGSACREGQSAAGAEPAD
jgi:CBS domain-containing protein